MQILKSVSKRPFLFTYFSYLLNTLIFSSASDNAVDWAEKL